ncbi:hypothetical protein FJV41_39190 [Myxococcus llanfairpwllgwyngyllgogerychwyrndrobwllllantysiliogogogochensis]|uniref:Uncharacterized protein n=1 Tax=Myxococcus llanfairpwllgwyngyllgogerychwyrndrobwllllantysiliogogogochensis TaxID=2590453 RepID=A0A540WNA6_9BACT|nr:hypothetical protein [Myxococcus llanfairpwllgwyngyllgogerychwyrndrobwllllantysiliogogogochensis]TQF10490.1 hypothetical protein FJV41_39190 [Myxococcus llanfairpwllgwyngyllgogerychwyrndrobwllllantysiliogogogochensis]
MSPEFIGAALYVFGGLVHLGCGALVLLAHRSARKAPPKQRTSSRGIAPQPLRVLPGGRSTTGGTHG